MSEDIDMPNEELHHLRSELKTSSDQVKDTLLATERSSRSAKSTETVSNWMLAVTVGTLLLFVNYIGRFSSAGTMPMKWLYLLALAVLTVSVICFGITRFLLLSRLVGMDRVLDSIEHVIKRLNLETLEPQKLPTNIGDEWARFHNIIYVAFDIIRWGFLSYVVGFTLSTVYVFVYIVKYL